MCGIKTGRVFGFVFLLDSFRFAVSESVVFVSLCGPLVIIRTAPPTLPPPLRDGDGLGSHLDVLLHAELRQGLLDAQGGEPGRSVGVPALPHDLPHHTQRLHTEGGGGHTVTQREREETLRVAGLVGMTQKNLFAEKIKGLRCRDEEAGSGAELWA